MKVIQNNYQNKTIAPSNNQKKMAEKVEVECENCGSILEVSREDTHVGWLGLQYATCPCCDYEMGIEEFDDDIIDICASNIKYPTHFTINSKDFTAVEIDDDQINEWIQEGIDWFRCHKDQNSYYVGSGNAMMHMYRYSGDEEYDVVISKDYEEGSIQFEEEDYEEENKN